MGILSAVGVDASAPFCDWLDLTVPRDSSSEVEDILSARLGACYGAQKRTPDTWILQAIRRACRPFQGGEEVGLIAESRKSDPTVRVDTRAAWCRVSLSGQAVEAIRAQDQWVPLLADLAALPHRVTRLDASLDLDIPGPLAVPAVLRAGRSGSISLGRKSLSPKDVTFVDKLDARGDVTGTVYLGKRTREISAAIYDKRHEREDAGLEDLGPCTRVELRLRALGCTLRDAAVPSALFWNYGRALVDAPPGAPDWTAAGQGWDMPPAQPPDYLRIMDRRLDTLAPELDSLKGIALRLGPYGPAILLRRIAQALGVERLVLGGVGA